MVDLDLEKKFSELPLIMRSFFISEGLAPNSLYSREINYSKIEEGLNRRCRNNPEFLAKAQDYFFYRLKDDRNEERLK